MEIEIQNCNSIDNAKIVLQEGKLNIKYGINGTGKTSIAKAINYAVEDNKTGSEQLKVLTPFKHLNNSEVIPKVDGVESINNIMIFNEEYVENFVFDKTDLLKNSFEILIKNNKYNEKMEDINKLLNKIDETFKTMPEIDNLISDINKLKEYFGDKKIDSVSTVLGKTLFKGAYKVNDIPEHLIEYKEYIQHEDMIKWMSWQTKGKEHMGISEKCPFCVTQISNEKREKIEKIEAEYDSKVIDSLNKLLIVIESLGAYFTKNTYYFLANIVKSNKEKLNSDAKKFLEDLRNDVTALSNKLNNIKYNMKFNALKNVSKVIQVIVEYKIDLNAYEKLNTDFTQEKIKPINEALDSVLVVANDLQIEINKQKSNIKNNIDTNKNEINQFLKDAGYSYHVIIEDDGTNGDYKLKLIHSDSNMTITNGKSYLSFGERNALALILFMFDAIKKSPDLIILDDPISSFDKNKKYAIMHKLFNGKKNLRGKTILLLTHDFEPIIDMVKVKGFEWVNANYLVNKNGVIDEKTITDNEIETIKRIAEDNIKKSNKDIIKLIYMRRLFEVNGEKDNAYSILSRLFHKTPVPSDRRGIPYEASYITSAIEKINGYLDFSYNDFYKNITNNSEMIRLYENAKNNYEKLQLYRIIMTSNNSKGEIKYNEIIEKFVDETYHIENDYLFQLNPQEFDMIPDYIVNMCNETIEKLKKCPQHFPQKN